MLSFVGGFIHFSPLIPVWMSEALIAGLLLLTQLYDSQPLCCPPPRLLVHIFETFACETKKMGLIGTQIGLVLQPV